jgi:hypothetical protein
MAHQGGKDKSRHLLSFLLDGRVVQHCFHNTNDVHHRCPGLLQLVSATSVPGQVESDHVRIVVHTPVGVLSVKADVIGILLVSKLGHFPTLTLGHTRFRGGVIIQKIPLNGFQRGIGLRQDRTEVSQRLLWGKLGSNIGSP